MATPPRPTFSIPSIPNLPSPSGSRTRGSISSSFSLDPSQLVHSFHFDPKDFALDPNRSILTGSPLFFSPRRPRRGKEITGETHPLARDTTADVFLETDNEESMLDSRASWSMVERMRLWGMMRSGSTYTRLPHSGETRSLVGRVSIRLLLL